MRDYKAESTRCTALTTKGAFCDRGSLPDAPFPICVKHASQLLRYLNSMAPRNTDDRIIVAARAYEHRPETPRKSATAGREVVYYLGVGNKVKIGYTSDLRQRLNGYPPDSVLLATEPGDQTLERQRHREFAAYLKVGKEWFEPGSQLMAHVTRLRAKDHESHELPARRPPTEATDKYGVPLGAAF